MKAEEYLPKEIQDFHDQKELFKEIQQEKTPNNWVDNHIYTIDYFLYYMAKVKGYKLQKIRKHKKNKL